MALIQNVNGWFDRHPKTLVVTCLILYPALAAVLVFGYFDRQHVRHDNRRAIILLAHAQCESSAVFEKATLKTAKTPQAVDLIHQFFLDYNAATNKALTTLHAAPCGQKGATP